MNRSLALLSSAALLAASATAQCFSPTGTSITGVMTPTLSGYPVTDEGISPELPLGFNFPMAGVGFTITHCVVNANGEVYLTDGLGGGAIGMAGFGCDSLAEFRGGVGGSPRIVVWSDDLDGADILVDDTVPGQFKVTWVDYAYWTQVGTIACDFSVTLYDTGVIELSYGGDTFDPSVAGVGVSIGNDVGTGTEVEADLAAGGDTGSLGLVYDLPVDADMPWNLMSSTLTLSPNGSGGYAYGVSCQQPPASHTAYGAGCYAIANSSNYQVFPDSPTAKAAMDGNAILYTLTANGYDASWVAGGGAAYVAPSGAAVTLITGVDDGNQAFTPSTPIPVPGGVATDLNIAANGILTMAATANHATDWTPTAAEMLAAPELAFYLWRDFNTSEAGSGPIVSEEVGNMLYVTFDAVEAYGTPSPNPATFQWQIDMSSGNVMLCVVSMEGSTSTDDTLIGCTLAGAGLDTGSVDLATALPLSIAPDIDALVLSAGPNPVSTPSAGTTVTYTMSNVPDANVNSGIRIAATVISFTQDVPGTDLGIIGAPGCNLHIGSLDLILSTIDVANNSTLSVTFDIPANVPAGVEIYAQAAALVYPGSLPNGQNVFGATTSNGIASYISPL